MGQILHGSAKTTHAIRAELQRSKASAAELARRYGINEKTVLKWCKRPSVEDMLDLLRKSGEAFFIYAVIRSNRAGLG